MWITAQLLWDVNGMSGWTNSWWRVTPKTGYLWASSWAMLRASLPVPLDSVVSVSSIPM